MPHNYKSVQNLIHNHIITVGITLNSMYMIWYNGGKHIQTSAILANNVPPKVFTPDSLWTY
jgi:hypothetical protein